MANATALADLLAETEDPATWSREFNQIVAEQLEPWYHDTVALDAEVNALWSRASDGFGAGRGRRRTISHAEAVAAAGVDPVVYVAYNRYRNPPRANAVTCGWARSPRSAVVSGVASCCS